MSRYGYSIKCHGITDEQKDTVDAFIDNMKESGEYNKQADMLNYLSSRLHEVCQSNHDTKTPLWRSSAIEYVTNSSVGSECPTMYEYIRYILDNCKKNITHTDAGIYQNYSVKVEGDSTYIRLFNNQSGKSYIIKHTMWYDDEKISIAHGNRKNVFHYEDCRDDKYIFGFDYKVSKYRGNEFAFDDDMMLHTYKDIKYFSMVLARAYDDLKYNDENK